MHEGKVLQGQSEKSANYKPRRKKDLSRNKLCHPLELELVASETVRNTLLYKPPACGVLLRQPKQTNTSREYIWNGREYISFSVPASRGCLHSCLRASSNIFKANNTISSNLSLPELTVC